MSPLFLVGLVFFSLSSFYVGTTMEAHKMNTKTSTNEIISCLFLAIAFTILMYGFRMTVDDQYMKGQIDAVTGNMKYELVVQPDSTVTWEKK
jgi:hypothetical protein